MLVGLLLVWCWEKKDEILRPIYYASKAPNEAQKNYTVTEQELLVVVFAFEKKFAPICLAREL